LRIADWESRTPSPSTLGIGYWTFYICLLAAAGCNPYSTRPVFVALPDAPVTYLDAPRARIVPDIRARLDSLGFRVTKSEPQDGYVETAWYDPETKRSYSTDRDVPHRDRVFRIRCWLEPDVPGASKLTLEVVYRPIYDPSRTSRDLEVLVPDEHPGQAVGTALIEALKEKFGVPRERS
jgi:hypothetical protein